MRSQLSQIRHRIHLSTHKGHLSGPRVMSMPQVQNPIQSLRLSRRQLIHQPEGDMSAVPILRPGQQVFLTIHWKDKLDATEPRWRHWFFNNVYLPFQRFSFKLGIPRVKEATVVADKNGKTYTTFSWFENGSVYPDSDQADAACFDERDGYKPIYWGQTPPRNSAEIGGLVFPRAKNPRRWTKPTLALMITPRKEQEQIKAELKRLHEILDQ